MPVCKDCVIGLFHACHNEEYCRQEKSALIEQAQEAAKNEGHSLAKFTKQRKVAVWRAECVRCGRVATVCLSPSRGEPDVHGEAVTGICTEAEPEMQEAPEKDTAWYEDLASGGE